MVFWGSAGRFGLFLYLLSYEKAIWGLFGEKGTPVFK